MTLTERKQFIAARVEQNSRRWGSAVTNRPNQPLANRFSQSVNCFSPVSLLFCYAIAMPKTTSETQFGSVPSLLNLDHAVLHEIIVALGTIVQCNRQGPEAPVLARQVFDVIFLTRFHHEATVRRYCRCVLCFKLIFVANLGQACLRCIPSWRSSRRLYSTPILLRICKNVYLGLANYVSSFCLFFLLESSLYELLLTFLNHIP